MLFISKFILTNIVAAAAATAATAAAAVVAEVAVAVIHDSNMKSCINSRTSSTSRTSCGLF